MWVGAEVTKVLVDASEVARIVGTSRQLVSELASTEPGFPPAGEPVRGRRVWDRDAIVTWAAAHPEARPAWRGPQLPEPGSYTKGTWKIMRLAFGEAIELGHDRTGDVHLLLALLHPDCPGAARVALERCGLRLEEVRRSVVRMPGRPKRPQHGTSLDRGAYEPLERANLKALELRDEEVSSEHVLLALTDAWRNGEAQSSLAELDVAPEIAADRAIALTETSVGEHRGSAPAVPVPREVGAAEVARILGISRAEVAELMASPDFPAAELGSCGARRWCRGEILMWAARHPGRGVQRTRRGLGAPGELEPRLDEIFRLAETQARELNHRWVGSGHLLLALLDPDCPGLARKALESFGIYLKKIRQAWIETMGDPFEPGDLALVVPPGTHHLLERAKLHAAELEDDAIVGEHVLLALTDGWRGSDLAGLNAEGGIDAASLRRRMLAVSDGMLTAHDPPPPRPDLPVSPKRVPRPPDPELAPSPVGHDPRRRRPWGSSGFTTQEGKSFPGHTQGQYFIDRDGYPVLTTDGKPIHILLDHDGRRVLAEDGKPIIGALDVPPGTQMQAHYQGSA
jgi:predicted DNA-binding transcriptional regulator AlpA